MRLYINSLEDLKKINSSVTQLVFNNNFNETLKNGKLVPSWIKKIVFEYFCDFNEPLNSLPQNLETLICNPSKKHTLKEIKSFPRNLKELELGWKFNLKLEKNILPPELKKLGFGELFNQKIEKDVLPKTLEKLSFEGDKFNQKIEKNVLPLSLKHLEFAWNTKFNYVLDKEILPPKLKEIIISKSYSHLDTIPKNISVILI